MFYPQPYTTWQVESVLSCILLSLLECLYVELGHPEQRVILYKVQYDLLSKKNLIDVDIGLLIDVDIGLLVFLQLFFIYLRVMVEVFYYVLHVLNDHLSPINRVISVINNARDHILHLV